MPAQVERGDPVARLGQDRHREPVRAAQLAHAGQADNQRPFALHVVGHPPTRTVQEADLGLPIRTTTVLPHQALLISVCSDAPATSPVARRRATPTPQ